MYSGAAGGCDPCAALTATALALAFCGRADEPGLALMEGESLFEDAIVTSTDEFDEIWIERHASLSGKIDRMTSATQQPLHLARPFFLLDLDEGLEFAQMVGVA